MTYEREGNKIATYIVQIIVPVYNAEKTLRKCLDSIKAQTFSEWQAFLIDDASTDGSREIMRQYAEEDARFVCHFKEKNGGASAAKNDGLKLLSAEYAAFLDSDDFWEPDMLERLYEKAQKYDADVVQCRFMYDFSDGKQLAPTGAFPQDVFLEGKALRKVYIKMMTGINMNHVCMKLFRVSLLEGIEFDTKLPTAEDLEFCVRVFRNVKRYVFSAKVMYHYYRRSDSLTGRGLPVMVRLSCNRRVARVMAQMLEPWGINTLPYRALTYFRPYLIIVSKVFRIIREKLF